MLYSNLAGILLTTLSIFSQPASARSLRLNNGLQQSLSGQTQAPAQKAKMPHKLQDLLDAIEVMQDNYFDMFAGTWGSAIDWTAAVTGTYVSATLSSIVEGLHVSKSSSCSESLGWTNLIDKYYMHTAFFYHGEDSFSLRNQAFDDMLWVVLGWLESIKFADMYSAKHWDSDETGSAEWHGLQLRPMASHRARIFYELASDGWDTALCGGGMTWNPSLEPYKNAITNELYTAASISMYLYFPGDNNTSPFSKHDEPPFGDPHDPLYLENAVKSYKWLKESQMQNEQGLYQDGYHITGWKRYPNGTIDTGTEACDDLNHMVYTYNQGVMLTASRGLWLATGARSYLDDGHALVSSVIRATGWPNEDRVWHGLGRGGVLEEFCDHRLYCSQDGQTFKGIFFHHFTEFCRPLRPQEEKFMTTSHHAEYKYHLQMCAAYKKWIEHNAEAALKTRNNNGLFGMWWGMSQHPGDWHADEQRLPPGAVDYLNPAMPLQLDMTSKDLNDRGRGRTVETQGGALAVLRARWHWQTHYS